jgi:hypothetical protein
MKAIIATRNASFEVADFSLFYPTVNARRPRNLLVR